MNIRGFSWGDTIAALAALVLSAIVVYGFAAAVRSILAHRLELDCTAEAWRVAQHGGDITIARKVYEACKGQP